jgi:WD40 repeat protein
MRKPESARLRLPALALTALAMIVVAVPAQAGEEVKIDGTLHIMNSAVPANGNRVVQLEEVWRVGGDDGEDFFGMISQVRIGDDGMIYLLDTRLSEVPVYSRDGERVNTLSREGDGPGETRIPSNLLFMPDGTLGLVQVFPGKIIKVATDGTPAGTFQPGGGDPTQGGFLQMFDCVANGEDLVVTAEAISTGGPTAQDRSNYVASFDAEGKELVRYFENNYHWDFTNFEFNEDELDRINFRRVAAGPDGRLYVATARNSYVITVYNRDGSVDRVIEREFDHYKRTTEEFERVESIATAQLRQIPNAKIVISEIEPDIGALTFGPDGNLWVSTSRSGRGQPDGIMVTWDVFTPEGHFVETVSAAADGDGENDIIIWADQESAVMVTGFTEAARALNSGGAGAAGDDDEEEAEPMEVVYLRVAGV